MSDDRFVVLAVDIGGSKYVTGFVTESGECLWKERRLWQTISAEAVMEQLKEAIGESLARAKAEGLNVRAIGLTIPGLADSAAGVWVSARFMGIYDLPIAALLQEEFSLPVWLDNDCQACALAEKRFGGCADCEDFLYLTVSNGVGGALFLNGKLYYGASGFAGEMSQLPVAGSYPDECQTLETMASGRALARRYLELGGCPAEDGTDPGGDLLARRADAGDGAALEAFRQEGYYLGRGILAAGKLTDPARVVIGGGLSLVFDYYKETLIGTLHAGYKGRALPPVVVPTALGYDGGLLGAAAVALRGLEGDVPR